MLNGTFSESTQKFIDALGAVKERRGIPEGYGERKEYLANVLAPVTKALLAAVNAFGFPYREVAEYLAKSDARDNAYNFATEYLWWLGHLDESFTDLRDRCAREKAIELIRQHLRELGSSSSVSIARFMRMWHS